MMAAVAGDNPSASTAELHQLPSSFSTTTAVLPTDSINEILTRLPVKPLLRFKSVSKSLKTLISSTEFVKHHLTRLKSPPNPLLLISSASKFGYRSCPVDSLYEIPSFTELDHAPILIEPHSKPYWLVGSLDGLICVVVKQLSVVLWNPSTRAFSTLPPPAQLDSESDDGKQRRRPYYPVFGFGYHALSDDYKVVSVSCYPNKDGPSSGVVQVCSVKSRVWKRIEDFKYGLPSNYPGKYVNNSLNWVMDDEFSSIVSLDLGSETYREVMQPEEEGVVISHKEKTIGVVEDCLCVMYHLRSGYSDLWVMKESWTKLFRIDMRRDWEDDELRRLEYFVPVYVAGGKALLWLWSSFAVYSYEDGRVVYWSDDIWSCQVYLESLVSPESENH
ncbi:F-box protein CPR1 [Linum grandiflorum]